MATIVYEGKDGALVRRRVTLPRGVPVEVSEEDAEALTQRDDVNVVEEKKAKSSRSTSRKSDSDDSDSE